MPGRLAFSSAPAMAIAPRSLPEKSFSEPINLPTGVRAPATITDVVIPTSKGSSEPLKSPIGEAQSFPPGYRYVMTAEQVDARPVLATALVTAIDHVGIAVARSGRRDQVVPRPPRHDRPARRGQRGPGHPRGDAVGAWRSRGQRSGPADGPAGRDLDDRQVPRQARSRSAAVRLPGQRYRRVERAAARAGRPAASTTPPGAAPRTPGSTSSIPRMAAAC